MSELTFDLQHYFDWNGIRIFQDDRVLKVGTDALLLGGWIPRVARTPGRILDAGTGCGVLALMLGHSYPESRIDGVDVDHVAVELASLNIQKADMARNIRILHEDITAAMKSPESEYDLVVSNPPFYSDSLLPVNALSRRAKHTEGPKPWIQAMVNNLSFHGEMGIIVPAHHALEWIFEANSLGYYVNNRLDVYSIHGDPVPKRSLLLFTPVLTKPEIGSMYIQYRKEGYTPEYLALTGIRNTR